MRIILNKLFLNKKLAFWMPLLLAMSAYLLFALFGSGEDKGNALIAVPIGSLIWFFGVFGVIFLQIKNPCCSECFLNFLELFATVLFVGTALILFVLFLVGGFQDFHYGICPGVVTCSAVSWAHGKR